MNIYKETEEIILAMADIVMENRQLRKEVQELREIKKEYVHFINEQTRKSERDFADTVKLVTVNILNNVSLFESFRKNIMDGD